MTKRLKTAKELGLSHEQYCGLVKTLEALESGKLDHKNEYIKRFNMNRWGGTCGAVCCLGGTAEAIMKSEGKLKRGFGYRPTELDNLFFPYHTPRVENKKSAWRASTKQAAVALRHYLMTGKENWAMAMETPR